jgi:HAD superfamily hydrolase (TIGR01549 family)
VRLDDIDLLSLDAGNTVIFLDHARLETIARAAGHDVQAKTLVVDEGFAKRALSGNSSDLVDIPWSHVEAPGARGWGQMMATIFTHSGVRKEALAVLLDRLWASHVEWNLYSVVPEGFHDAMSKVREAGVKVAVVSNSEGMLESLFDRLGILDCFDTVVDSAKVGVEKPHAHIFEIACERTSTTPSRSLHLGDTFATDIVGARNAGMRTALIDPYGHYEGLLADVERAPGVVPVSEEILRVRSRTP